MSKDVYWFKHHSNSGRGVRMRKMQRIYGHWGKGVYWDIIEILREQDGYTYPLDELSLQGLADLIGCDEAKFIGWFNHCVQGGELFCRNKTHFWNEPLLENMKIWETKKSNGSKGGRPVKNRNHNRIESETITETITGLKANHNQYSIEEKRREDKSESKESAHTENPLKNFLNENKESSGEKIQTDAAQKNSGAQGSQKDLSGSQSGQKNETGTGLVKNAVVAHWQRLRDSPTHLEAFAMSARKQGLFPQDMGAEDCKAGIVKFAQDCQMEFDKVCPGEDYKKFGYRFNDYLNNLAKDPERKPWEAPPMTKLPYSLPENPAYKKKP